MKKKIYKIIIFYLSFFCAINAQKKELFRDETAPMHNRIMDLLNRLTIEEKIGLLRATSPEITRLNIDKYYHGNEALHGIVRPGNFTVFPQAIGMASMWNPDLQYRIATVASTEARARWNELEQGKKQQSQFSDLLTFWSPTVNMARDPRWGRTPETYGEDPYLSGVLGAQYVKGLQGNDPKYVKTVSTPKHFAANNEEHNRFVCNPQISERQMREYYLPAFESCIIEGKAQSIMTAYNAINDIPCTLNTWLIGKVLKQDWGFDGYVVSDCGGPSLLVSAHKYVKTKEAAATLSIKAGLDLECGDDVYIQPLLNAYNLGMVSNSDIDSAAYRVLRARMRLGVFDDPNLVPYTKISPNVIGCAEHKELALEAARECIVLLKNKNNTLPINTDKVKTIGIVGINAANCELGDYSGIPVGEPVSILKGIENKVGSKIKIIHAPWVSSADGYELISKSFFPNGLKAQYFSNKNLNGIPKERIDNWINFEPKNQAPDPFLPKSPISIRWEGILKPTISGKYSLGFRSDDGCRLYLDNQMLIDSWKNRSAKTDVIDLELEAGKEYILKAEYFDDGGDCEAKLFWKTPEVEKMERIALFGDAGKVARSSDMIIAVLGINQSIEREGQDREYIRLPRDQEEFIQEIHKINPNIIVVLVAGSSLAINWIDKNIPAIVNAWYPGEQGGTAVADVLFGDYNPAGRLPLTYYNDLSEIPSFDDYNITKGRTYRYFEGKPLYPFGYGLSYTTFNYKKLKVSSETDKINISFEIENKGRMDGDEVSQVYVKLPRSVNDIPLKELKGFKRVRINKGRTERVIIEIPKDQLRYWDVDQSKFITPQGEYKIMVGASSDDIRLTQSLFL